MSLLNFMATKCQEMMWIGTKKSQGTLDFDKMDIYTLHQENA